MVLIYLPLITPRCEYIFKLVFTEEFGLNYRLSTDLELFNVHVGEKLNYSSTRGKDELFIKASTLLSETGIKKTDMVVKRKFSTAILFATDTSCDLGFDIFSAIFYMVSRYEEYLPFTPDKFGRFEGAESLAYKNKFLHQPVVNTWIKVLGELLITKFPTLKLKPSSFRYIATYDIDIAYSFKGKSFMRLLGASLNDALQLKFKNIFLRIRSLDTKRKDPFDVYALLRQTIEKYSLESIFFFLLADYSSYDKNVSYRHPLMQELVKNVSAFSEIGIHPSFKTPLSPKMIAAEKNRLEELAGKPIDKSRQHYLRFRLPATYNHLLSAGLKEDYSMGFADLPGFRAGTCKPFYFYDLQKELATTLKIFPVTIMEGTFVNYLQVQPAEALEQIIRLIEEVENVNGTFISIWHNHTVSETGIYKGWKIVHDKMIERLVSGPE